MASRVRGQARPTGIRTIWEADDLTSLPEIMALPSLVIGGSNIVPSLLDLCVVLSDNSLWIRSERAWERVGGAGDSSTSTPGTVGPPGWDGEPGDDGAMGPPGAPGFAGAAGVAGAAGLAGAPGPPGLDGDDGVDSYIPGPAGMAGAAGTAGAPGTSIVGPMGPPGLDAEDPEGPYIIPGQKGDAGAPGAPGGSGTATTVEVDLGTVATWRGKFTITDASISAAKKVMCWQAPGPYTGKGTRADEAELQPVKVTSVEPLSGTATVAWETPPYLSMRGFALDQGKTATLTDGTLGPIQMLATRINRARGNVKFSYAVFS